MAVTGFNSLNSTEYANGWDGYYYLIQVQSLNNTGAMHSPEYSLVYLPVIALHAITGDYVASYKISAALIKTLFVLSVYSLTLSLLRARKPINCVDSNNTSFYAALLAAALSAASPSLNFFFTQFPKNLLGFALLFFFISLVYRTSRIWRTRTRRNILGIRFLAGSAGSVLLLGATYFTHRFSAVLSLVFLMLFFLPWLKRLSDHLRTTKKQSKGSSLVSWLRKHIRKAILLIPLIFFVLLSGKLSLALSFYDLEVITDNLSHTPIFVPVSFIQAFGYEKLTTAWTIEIFLACVLPVLTVTLLLCRKRFNFLRLGREYYILIIISLTGPFPFFKFSLTGLSYRLLYATLLIFPLLCAPYINHGIHKIIEFTTDKKRQRLESMLILLFVFLLISSFYTGRSYNPEIHDPPYDLYQELAEESITALADIEFELIIAHKALAEIITYTHEVDALPWAPEDYFPRQRVWRITAGILRDEVAMYLSPELADRYFFSLSRDYALMREDHWEAFVQSIANEPVMLEAVHTWRNPMEQRPAYMQKAHL
ncbi:MAG: hypothetical protein KAH31_06725 [Candidatus Sabulitectum sp.]|nr:hypothetical protein [Candidatus Sabulitectum sp.]